MICDTFMDGIFPLPDQSEKESNQSENEEESYTSQDRQRDKPILESEESAAQRNKD